MRRLPQLLFALSLATTASAEKVATMPAPVAYVDDYAGVLSTDGKAAVEAICRDVHDKTKAQIFFVTIKSLDGESIEDFSNELFHNWKIGEKKTDRGILLLLAVNDHKRRMEVGYGLEGILPDAKTGRIGDDMVPALKSNNYDEAAKIGVQEVADVIAADAKVTLDPVPEAAPARAAVSQSFESDDFPFVAIVLIFGFAGLFVFLIWRAARRGSLQSSTGGSSSSAIGFGSGFGSSDSSSSSSSDSSSSDSSFSGGDGGDSGGGGSSGSW
jgi:uncharacterized protein